MNLARWLRQASLHEGGQWPRSAHPDAKGKSNNSNNTDTNNSNSNSNNSKNNDNNDNKNSNSSNNHLSKDFPQIRQELQDSSSSRLHDAHLKGASKLCF